MAETGFRGPPTPHPTGYMYPVPQSRETSISKLSVPFLLVFGGALALVSATGGITYSATMAFTQLKSSIDTLSEKVTQKLDSQDERIGRLERDVSDRTADRYTRTDHDLWCSRTEQLNAKLGWRCSDAAPANRARLRFMPPIYQEGEFQ